MSWLHQLALTRVQMRHDGSIGHPHDLLLTGDARHASKLLLTGSSAAKLDKFSQRLAQLLLSIHVQTSPYTLPAAASTFA